MIRKYHVLLTEVDLIRSFTDNLKRISVIVSSGRSFKDVVEIAMFFDGADIFCRREKLGFGGGV